MGLSRHQSGSPPGQAAALHSLDLDHVYAQFVGPVYRFLYARVGNREDAEDLTSQVFVKAFRQLDVAREERSVASWLFTVARTVLADHWRDEYRHGPVAELSENLIERVNAQDGLDDSDKIHRVASLLARLSPRYRSVLELRFLRGYSVEETARELGMTASNVKVTQHRALAKAASLTEYGVRAGCSPVSGDRVIA
jgi:RNA polymerase sigma-70 factor (ECF subfamily)